MNNDEYLDLRKEIMHCINRSTQVSLTMFSIVSLIFAYLLSKDNTINYAFLSPIPIILSCHVLGNNALSSVYKIAAYIVVYTEKKDDFQWEKRLNIYREENKEAFKKKGFLFYLSHENIQYFSSYLTCVTFYLYYTFLKYPDKNSLCNPLFYVDILLLIPVSYIGFILKATNYDIKMKNLIDIWEKVKEKEKNL